MGICSSPQEIRGRFSIMQERTKNSRTGPAPGIVIAGIAIAVIAGIFSIATIAVIIPALQIFGTAMLTLLTLFAVCISAIFLWGKFDEVQGRRREREVQLQLQLERANRLQVGPYGAEGIFDRATGAVL